MVPEVPSGRSVNSVSLAFTVYISFWTTSVVSPTERRKRSVFSNVGTLISEKPKLSAISLATFSTVCHLYTSFGRTSSVPFGRLILTAIYKLSFLYGYMKIVPEKGTIYIIQIAGLPTSRQSRSPLSRASISASAVAIFVATGTLCTSHSLRRFIP